MAHAVEITSGPVPDPNLPGPYIPLMKDTIDNLSTKRTMFDYGDIQVAYYNVGLGAKRNQPAPPKPSREQAEDYFRRLVWHVTAPARSTWNARSQSSRREKINRCLMSIRTLHHYRTENLDKSGRIDLTDDDRAINVPDSAWDDLPDPLPDWAALSDYIDTVFQPNRDELAFRYQPAGELWPSAREYEENSRNKYHELRRYLDSCRASGFTATHSSGHAELGVINFPEDGNSLWYCLAYGPPMGGGSREAWTTIKFRIWKYFNHVLAHPAHPRHRMYVVLQQESSHEIEARTPGSERLWGRMSIQRALYTNKPHSGPPMYCNFTGIYQVIADFFGKEVVVFTRRTRMPVWADLRADPPRHYEWRAHGRINDGLDRGQILLVTDETPEQYQIAIYFDGHPEQYFDTSSSDAEDRYGWIDAPWMIRPLASDYEPIHLPLAPIDDNAFKDDIQWSDLFFGLGNVAREDKNEEANETIFPDPDQAGWTQEWTVPPFPNPYPYPFGNNKIVTGIYIDAGGNERWPEWNNIKAYESHNFQQHAKDFGIDVDPMDKSM